MTNHVHGTGARYLAGCGECAALARALRARNPEAGRAAVRKWHALNPDRARAACDRWVANNPDAGRAKNRRQYTAHPEVRLVHNRIRRARKVGVKTDGHTRQEVFLRDKGTCQMCFLPVDPLLWHEDHRVPLVAGGPDTLDNCRVTHPRCNLSKGARVA